MAAKFEREHRAGQILESEDLFGTTQALVGAGRSNAGRPKLAIRLMASLLYLKHSFDLSDEELVVRLISSFGVRVRQGAGYFGRHLPQNGIWHRPSRAVSQVRDAWRAICHCWRCGSCSPSAAAAFDRNECKSCGGQTEWVHGQPVEVLNFAMPNAQAHRRACRSEAEARPSGAAPCWAISVGISRGVSTSNPQGPLSARPCRSRG